MLTDAQLQEWKRLTDDATPGPWESVGQRYVMAGGLCIAEVQGDAADESANGGFIAAAREAMPLLLAEVERLRVPASGNVGRVGFDAFRQQRAADGLPDGPTWEDHERDTPRWTRAWRAAGQAERAVAYALAAQAADEVRVDYERHAAPIGAGGARDAAEAVRALAQPPSTSAERLARLAALLREAGALAGDVAADADAPPEHRLAADFIRRGLLGRTSESSTDVATPLEQVKKRHGQDKTAPVIQIPVGFAPTPPKPTPELPRLTDDATTPTGPVEPLKDGES